MQPAQVVHLAQRMLELELQPAPILLVHRGPEDVRAIVAEVLRGPPDRAFSDRSGQHHRVWALRERGLLHRVSDGLADSRS